MDNDEAKFILRAYRPNGVDASDSQFADALDQAKRDPSLARWWQDEQALDRAIADRLRHAPIPNGLRESILTGAKVSSRPRAGWRAPVWFALAASLVVAFGVTFSYSLAHRRAAVEQVAQVAIEDVLHGHHGNRGEAVAQLETVLENSSFRLTNGTMPANLTALESNGCRTLNIAGQSVAEICFARSGRYYHLYVMSRVGGMPQKPRMIEHDGARAAAWADEHNSYIVATTASLGELKNIL